jgi:hypothetical protein
MKTNATTLKLRDADSSLSLSFPRRVATSDYHGQCRRDMLRVIRDYESHRHSRGIHRAEWGEA